jgi:hypothetical protein
MCDEVAVLVNKNPMMVFQSLRPEALHVDNSSINLRVLIT